MQVVADNATTVELVGGQALIHVTCHMPSQFVFEPTQTCHMPCLFARKLTYRFQDCAGYNCTQTHAVAHPGMSSSMPAARIAAESAVGSYVLRANFRAPCNQARSSGALCRSMSMLAVLCPHCCVFVSRASTFAVARPVPEASAQQHSPHSTRGIAAFELPRVCVVVQVCHSIATCSGASSHHSRDIVGGLVPKPRTWTKKQGIRRLGNVNRVRLTDKVVRFHAQLLVRHRMLAFWAPTAWSNVGDRRPIFLARACSEDCTDPG